MRNFQTEIQRNKYKRASEGLSKSEDRDQKEKPLLVKIFLFAKYAFTGVAPFENLLT
jgi:hypothetical protein